MKKEYRFRTGMFKKVILQIRNGYGNISYTQPTAWRDAKLKDIDIDILNIVKKEK